MAEALGTNSPSCPTGLKTHCNEDSSALSPYFALFLNSPPPSSQSPVLRPTISSALGSDVSTEEVQLTCVVNDTSASYWFFRACVCFSLCLASIFFFPPCLDTVSLSFFLSVKHRFILPVMRGEESSVSAQG